VYIFRVSVSHRERMGGGITREIFIREIFIRERVYSVFVGEKG
jgi:hypothetical protein